MKPLNFIHFFFLSIFVSRAADDFVVADFSIGVDAKGIPMGWELKERSGRADFSVLPVDGVQALQIRSSASSYSFQKKVKVDLAEYPILCWKWNVTQLPEGGDFRHSRTDDQAAQLFVAFSRSKIISYIWDTSAPQGLVGDALAPPTVSIKVVVVRSTAADTGKWLTETRNVYEDYSKLFGKTGPPPLVSGVRIQINSQHTKSSAESSFADIIFTRQGSTR